MVFCSSSCLEFFTSFMVHSKVTCFFPYKNPSLGALQVVLPLHSPFSSPSSPTKEPCVKGTVKSSLTLPTSVSHSQNNSAAGGARSWSKNSLPNLETRDECWGIAPHSLRAPWCSGGQTLHCALAQLSPVQIMGMAWGAGIPCPGMGRDQGLRTHLCFILTVVQTPGNSNNSPAAHLSYPGMSTLCSSCPAHTEGLCRLWNEWILTGMLTFLHIEVYLGNCSKNNWRL